MPTRANQSSVSDNFTKLSASKVQCNLCKRELAVSGGVTTGMHAHLRRKHVGVLESPVASTKSPVVPITGFVKQHSCPDGRQEKISSTLAKVIAENMLPISIVQSKSLRDLLALLDPGYKVPCRQTMTSRLESMHRSVSSKLQDTLAATDAVAVTTNIWTSMANEAYISFTASYVDHSWQLNSPVLSTVPIPERHKQAVIAEHLSDLASMWSITDKVVACMHARWGRKY